MSVHAEGIPYGRDRARSGVDDLVRGISGANAGGVATGSKGGWSGSTPLGQRSTYRIRWQMDMLGGNAVREKWVKGGNDVVEGW
jgi:hypothetical protein